MPDYDFHTLNDGDLELLVRDLLNTKEKAAGSGVVYHSYPKGRDQGIDLLYSSKEGSFDRIVQVKHYLNTPYKTLLSHLANTTKERASEKEKMEKLLPGRYIVATSQSLTRQNKNEIVKAMEPFIPSEEDVIDRVELNRLLSEFPEVEKDHYKLWFSSRHVFDRILNNDIHGRSQQLEEDVIQKFRLYVPTDNLVQAEQILEDRKFVVITGGPGSGKTTLSEMLLYRLAGKDFKMYWIEKSVAEVDKLLSEDDSPQVFYFDDFLGRTRIEIESAKLNEKGLLHFLKRLKKFPNKYFILTTRTSLFTQAAEESDRFKESVISRKDFEVNVAELSIDQKLQIIENHLVVYNVPKPYIDDLLLAHRPLEIANHKSFSPRIIGFVTQERNYSTVKPHEYYNYVLGHLNNPHEIWLFAYQHQISEYDRFLLTTLYSFGEGVEFHHLQHAFERRLQYEIAENNVPRMADAFLNSFKKLLRGFIFIDTIHKKEKVRFINPSLEDFLFYYLDKNEEEKRRIAYSFLYVEQIYKRFRHAGKGYLLLNPEVYFYNRLSTGQFETVAPTKGSVNSYVNLYLALITWMFYKNKKGVELCAGFLKQVDFKNLKGFNYYHLFGFMLVAHLEGDLKQVLHPYFITIAMYLIRDSDQLTHLRIIRDLFSEYGYDYYEFINDPNHQYDIKSAIHNHMDAEIERTIDSLKDFATEESMVWREERRLISELEREYNLMGIYEEPEIFGFQNEKWDAICINNLFAEMMAKDD
jgi:hypothetical protein